eukprot:s352_g20.t1
MRKYCTSLHTFLRKGGADSIFDFFDLCYVSRSKGIHWDQSRPISRPRTCKFLSHFCHTSPARALQRVGPSLAAKVYYRVPVGLQDAVPASWGPQLALHGSLNCAIQRVPTAEAMKHVTLALGICLGFVISSLQTLADTV